ncbi:hypothetical protein XBFM1_840011 [Xenorhabdus bovienii str. feltiae Moldova]|uniref:Uncharacterized protein n=1 Tax=Xenorhabdus bovienii str. feltiae Moldova TaxID=1398200 RepID=A0A077NNW2_XENBV|nr:hypothetical protein XBFM1_840011 [Xenorhabdus bovienii str. feltiae Moldova]
MSYLGFQSAKHRLCSIACAKSRYDCVVTHSDLSPSLAISSNATS